MNNEQTRILIVDDEEIVRESLSAWLAKDGYSVHTAPDGDAAIERIRNERWTILVVDLRMPGTDGLQVLQAAKGLQPDAVPIVMTAYATVDTAVAAMKTGAHDYLVKPFDPEQLSLMVRQIVAQQALLRENALLRQLLRREHGFNDLVGKSAVMRAVFDLARTAAHGQSPILMTGESGTGKESLARAIHGEGPQREGPFVPVACAALDESVLQSELLGSEARGSGAAPRKGRLEAAEGGTVFFDEIAGLGPSLQLDVLHVIEQRQFSRLGAAEPISANVRVIAATSKAIHKAAQTGAIRRDLYRRLSAIVIHVPPLRDRRTDIPLLVEHLLERLGVEMDRQIGLVSPAAMRLLMAHPWQGNVRELREVLERGVAVAAGRVIEADDLGLPPDLAGPGAEETSLVSLDEVERRHIALVLRQTGRNISRAARLLGIDRATLYSKMRRYQLGRDGSAVDASAVTPKEG